MYQLSFLADIRAYLENDFRCVIQQWPNFRNISKRVHCKIGTGILPTITASLLDDRAP